MRSPWMKAHNERSQNQIYKCVWIVNSPSPVASLRPPAGLVDSLKSGSILHLTRHCLWDRLRTPVPKRNMSHRAPSDIGCFWWHKNNKASPNTPQLDVKSIPTNIERRPTHTLKSDRCLVFSAGRQKKPCVFQSFYGLRVLFKALYGVYGG